MKLSKYAYSQFYNPRGLIGVLAGKIMASRSSNIQRSIWTLDLLNLDSHDTVLEIGYGPGLAIVECSKRAAEGFVVGVDHSQTMFEMATKNNRSCIDSGVVELRVGSIEDMDIIEEKYSKIYSCNVAQFWKGKERTIRYLKSLLVKGGILATTFQSRKTSATDRDSEVFAEEIVEVMNKSGFKNVRVERLDLQPIAVCILGENS